MKLYIAEKPCVAKVISENIGISKRCDGYIECKNGDLVTWCVGHLMEQAMPEAYLPEEGKKRWRAEDLPIIPKKWINEVKPATKKQFKVIGNLLKKCSEVVNCGDCDREGQLLVDEVLEHYNNKKTVLRYWSSANDDHSVKQALRNLQPNQKYQGMKNAALARSHADWLIGMNGTRAFTLAEQAKTKVGKAPLLSVGRVQTPTLNLVATRDLAIKNFKSKPFYCFVGNFKANDISFKANYQIPENLKGLDEEKRLVDPNVAKQLYKVLCNLKKATVRNYESKEKKQAQPKGFSLADIQNVANSKFGYSAEQTLNVCQSLYETHKLTSYPRSDCQFLPEAQHSDAKEILAALKATNPALSKIIDNADIAIKSATFDDSKITAHHAIIPTRQKGDLSKLSDAEKNIYSLIVKRYIAQFYPECRYLATTIELEANKFMFKTTGSVILDAGFKVIDSDEDKKKEDEQELPKLEKGQEVVLSKIDAITKKTTAPAAYTEGSLIKAMENISSVIEDPTYKKILKNAKGIGTSATRASIIAELKRKGYMEVKKNKVHVTELGFSLLSKLPDMIKNPVLTAMFESVLEKIENGKATYQEFENKQIDFVNTLIKQSKV